MKETHHVHRWWHRWSHWTERGLMEIRITIGGHPGHIKIQYRRCINCAMIQFRETP